MAVIAIREPSLVGTGTLKEPRQLLGAPLQGAAWRRGSILINKTTGAITAPSGGLGALAAVAGPIASRVTIVNSPVAGAPAQTYFLAVTETAAGAETQPSYFLWNAPAGQVPSVNVAIAGTPAGATNYAAYAGVVPGFYALQQATRTTTAQGTPFVLSSPLTNNQGWNQAITGSATNIIGVALSDSNATYFAGTGGSTATSGARVGPSVNIPPLSPFESPGFYAIGAGANQYFEMNLVPGQAYFPSLVNTPAGLTLDATSGYFVVDPAQAACLTIVGQRDGVYIGPTSPGTAGDTGARVIVAFLAAALAVV